MKKQAILALILSFNIFNTTLPSFTDSLYDAKDTVADYSSSALKKIVEYSKKAGPALQSSVSDVIKAYPSLSQEQKQVLGFTLLLPGIYMLYSSVSHDAEAKQKERSGIPFENHYVARKVGIVFSGAMIGLSVKALVDGFKSNPNLLERVEKLLERKPNIV